MVVMKTVTAETSRDGKTSHAGIRVLTSHLQSSELGSQDRLARKTEADFRPFELEDPPTASGDMAANGVRRTTAVQLMPRLETCKTGHDDSSR